MLCVANTIICQSVTIHTIYFCLYNGIQIMCGLKLSVIVTVGLRFFRPCVGRVGHWTLVMATMLLMTVSRVIASVDKVIPVTMWSLWPVWCHVTEEVSVNTCTIKYTPTPAQVTRTLQFTFCLEKWKQLTICFTFLEVLPFSEVTFSLGFSLKLSLIAIYSTSWWNLKSRVFSS